MEDICKDCEHNAGRTCNQNPRGYFEPYGNACQRVLDLYNEMEAERHMKELYLEEMHQISEIIDPGEHGESFTHQGILLQRVKDTISRLESNKHKKETNPGTSIALSIAIGALFRIAEECQDPEPPSLKELQGFAGESLQEIVKKLR